MTALSGSSDSDSEAEKNTNVTKTMLNNVQEANSTELHSLQREENKPDSDEHVPESENEERNEQHTETSGSESSSSISASSSESSSESEFDDGYDENLMGDEEDRKRLSRLSEKERETEIFKRIEQRDIMRTRWEIERKLKLARRSEKAKSKTTNEKPKKEKKKKIKKKHAKKPIEKEVTQENVEEKSVPSPAMPNVSEELPVSTTLSAPAPENIEDGEDEDMLNANAEYFDHKERSKERKKNVEMNKTDDKRSNAMALLKAKREGKAKRGKSNMLLQFSYLYGCTVALSLCS